MQMIFVPMETKPESILILAGERHKGTNKTDRLLLQLLEGEQGNATYKLHRGLMPRLLDTLVRTHEVLTSSTHDDWVDTSEEYLQGLVNRAKTYFKVKYDRSPVSPYTQLKLLEPDLLIERESISLGRHKIKRLDDQMTCFELVKNASATMAPLAQKIRAVTSGSIAVLPDLKEQSLKRVNFGEILAQADSDRLRAMIRYRLRTGLVVNVAELEGMFTHETSGVPPEASRS